MLQQKLCLSSKINMYLLRFGSDLRQKIVKLIKNQNQMKIMINQYNAEKVHVAEKMLVIPISCFLQIFFRLNTEYNEIEPAKKTKACKIFQLNILCKVGPVKP